MSTRRLVGLFVLLIVLVGLVWLGVKGWRVASAGRSLLQTQDRVSALRAAPGGLRAADPAAVDEIIVDVRADVVTLNRELQPLLPLTRLFGWLPRVGPLVVEADHYLALADAGTHAADLLRPLVRDGLLTVQSNPDNLLTALLDLADANRARFAAIEPDVQRAVSEYNAITSWEALPWAVRQYLPQAQRYVPLATDGIKLAQLLPLLTGSDGRLRTYMLLAQNADELRATGGYISGVGFLEIRDGEILSLSLTSGDEINRNLFEQSELYPFPPEPMLNYMGLQYHIFRDANYWPDFPTSVQQALNLYRLGQPDTPPVDGVIAFNQHLLAALVEVLQPLYIDAYRTSVNSANLTEFVWAAYDPAEDQSINYDWYSQRKAFMGLLAQAIISKVTGNPAAMDVPRLADAVLTAAKARNLLIWLTEPEAQTLVDALGWSGRMQPHPNQDQLMILDNNFGYNKVNYAVQRHARYAVDLSDLSAPVADLAVQYTHPVPAADTCQQFQSYSDLEGRAAGLYQGYVYSCYYNFVRVYTPLNTRLLDASRQAIPGDWLTSGTPVTDAVGDVSDTAGFGGFSNFLVVPRGGSQTLQMRYALPVGVTQTAAGGTTYRLVLLKTAGTSGDPFTVSVQLPIGAQVTAIEGPGTIVGSRVEFNLTLSADTTLSVTWQPLDGS